MTTSKAQLKLVVISVNRNKSVQLHIFLQSCSTGNRSEIGSIRLNLGSRQECTIKWERWAKGVEDKSGEVIVIMGH